MTTETTVTDARGDESIAQDTKLLGIYLNDHLAGATVGSHRMRRLAHAERDSPNSAVLQLVAGEIEEDEATLIDVMRRLGVERQLYKRAGAWVAERLGALKLNGRLIRRSPLTTLIELEMMQMAIVGKHALWTTLLRSDLPAGVDLEGLGARAKRQRKMLQQVHQQRATKVFDTAR